MPRRGPFSHILGIALLALLFSGGILALRSHVTPSAQAAQPAHASSSSSTSAPSTAASSSPSALTGHPWKLVGLTFDGHSWTLNPEAAVTITFADDKEGLHFDGSGGCNSYGGDYAASTGHLQVSEIFKTAMACLGSNVMAQENHYLGALRTATTFSATASNLTLSDASGQTVLHFAAA